ncbi:perlucin-like [Penaeus indicus]|uniref:perlucin-like n=1 Tax=Penaeus indicus TaxID=29960 RepID=UPI00300CF451
MRMLTRLAIFALLAASISGQPLQGRSQKTELMVAVGILEEHVQDIKQKVLALPNSGALCPYPYKQVLDECFFLSKVSLNWNQARQYCQGMQGDLATPRNVYALKSFIIDTAGEVTEAWLGATDQSSEGTWNWLDGRPIASDFAGGQPDDAGGNEDCLDIRLKWHPTLNDYQCGVAQRFVCQYKG